jgi:ribosomal protein S18 acetylase RimI-like enzyme
MNGRPYDSDRISIRPATGEDIERLHALVEGAYRGDGARRGWTHEADLLDGQRIDLPTLRAVLADGAQTVLLALDGADLVGCVQLADRGDGTAYLGMLSVDPQRQGEGLGRRLIAAAENAAARLGARRVEMTVIRQRAELIAYYERRDYRATGEERPFPLDDARFGLPRRRDLAFVVLAKNLQPLVLQT